MQRDLHRPEGAPQKLLDAVRMRSFGCSPRTTLEAGLRDAYRDYLSRFQSRP